MNNDLFEGQNKESIAVVQKKKKKKIVALASDAGRHANNYSKSRNTGAIKLF